MNLLDRQQVIIFEGPDSSGKSQIGRELSKRINVPYFKNNRESKRILSNLNSECAVYCGIYMADYLSSTGQNVIIDRFHISEYVYATVYNRETNFNDINTISRILTGIRAKVIYCYKENLDNYNDNHIEKEKIPKIKSIYDEYFLKNCRLQTLKLKTDDQDLGKQVRKILSFLKEICR